MGATVSDTAHEVEYEASAHTSRDRQVGPGCRRRHELAPKGPHPTGGPRVTEGAGGAGPSRKKCHGGPNEV